MTQKYRRVASAKRTPRSVAPSKQGPTPGVSSNEMEGAAVHPFPEPVAGFPKDNSAPNIQPYWGLSPVHGMFSLQYIQ